MTERLLGEDQHVELVVKMPANKDKLKETELSDSISTLSSETENKAETINKEEPKNYRLTIEMIQSNAIDPMIGMDGIVPSV